MLLCAEKKTENKHPFFLIKCAFIYKHFAISALSIYQSSLCTSYYFFEDRFGVAPFKNWFFGVDAFIEKISVPNSNVWPTCFWSYWEQGYSLALTSMCPSVGHTWGMWSCAELTIGLISWIHLFLCQFLPP